MVFYYILLHCLLKDLQDILIYFSHLKIRYETITTETTIIDQMNKFLINCHDEQSSTDVVYALALKIQDPLNELRIKYDWFNFMHNKNAINGLTQAFINDQYLYPMQIDEKVYVGGYKQSRIFHYYNKSLPEELNARIF